MYDYFLNQGISKDAYNFVQNCELECRELNKKLDDIVDINQLKVLNAFQEERIASRHFNASSGYGYDDQGRDAYERVFARVFNTEDALVRPQIVSGTHALSLALYGLLKQGDTLLSITGKPYDTLDQVIGVKGNSKHSLIANGVNYKHVDLTEDTQIDMDEVLKHLDSANVVYMQRSRGYEYRNAISIEQIKEAVSTIRKHKSDVIIMIDNCYGEFTDVLEPTDVGVDVAMGSLIKNPGGGLAPTGGYIVGKKEYIEAIADRWSAPGIGKEVGSYAASYTPYYQGLFLAPSVVGNCLKGIRVLSRMFEKFGYDAVPKSNSDQSDIILSVKTGSEKAVIDICKVVQSISPVDNNVVPLPWDMPGYNDKVIMAAGTFIQGSSIELSADAPIKEPYIVYIQGGLTYSHLKIAAMKIYDVLKKSE